MGNTVSHSETARLNCHESRERELKTLEMTKGAKENELNIQSDTSDALETSLDKVPNFHSTLCAILFPLSFPLAMTLHHIKCILHLCIGV